RDDLVTGVQTCALPILSHRAKEVQRSARPQLLAVDADASGDSASTRERLVHAIPGKLPSGTRATTRWTAARATAAELSCCASRRSEERRVGKECGAWR